MSRSGGAFSRILLLLAFGGCGAVVVPRVHNFDRCGQKGAAACPVPKESEIAIGQSIPRSEACANSGYLCTAEGAMDLAGVARWRLARGSLRVRVPLSKDVPEALAREYRRAAVEGIMDWQGHPFRFDVDTGAFPTQMWDVEVFWTYTLQGLGNYAGVTHYANARTNDDPEQRVRAIAVVTGSSWDAGSGDDIANVSSVAAHEMGHALGLGHSDDVRDVMWPTVTRAHPRVTARDLLAVDALYRLPLGATVAR